MGSELWISTKLICDFLYQTQIVKRLPFPNLPLKTIRIISHCLDYHAVLPYGDLPINLKWRLSKAGLDIVVSFVQKLGIHLFILQFLQKGFSRKFSFIFNVYQLIRYIKHSQFQNTINQLFSFRSLTIAINLSTIIHLQKDYLSFKYIFTILMNQQAQHKSDRQNVEGNKQKEPLIDMQLAVNEENKRLKQQVQIQRIKIQNMEKQSLVKDSIIAQKHKQIIQLKQTSLNQTHKLDSLILQVQKLENIIQKISKKRNIYRKQITLNGNKFESSDKKSCAHTKYDFHQYQKLQYQKTAYADQTKNLIKQSPNISNTKNLERIGLQNSRKSMKQKLLNCQSIGDVLRLDQYHQHK